MSEPRFEADTDDLLELHDSVAGPVARDEAEMEASRLRFWMAIRDDIRGTLEFVVTPERHLAYRLTATAEAKILRELGGIH